MNDKQFYIQEELGYWCLRTRAGSSFVTHKKFRREADAAEACALANAGFFRSQAEKAAELRLRQAETARDLQRLGWHPQRLADGRIKVVHHRNGSN